MRVAFPLILLLLAGLGHAGEIDAKVEAALAAESRPEADAERDRNRKPLATLKFFGLEDDMTVLELIPGGGWYTRVLAPVLAENGKLYVALGTNYVSENVLTEPGFEKVEVIETDANIRRPEGSRYYALDDFEFGISGVDMVLTFRNVHNFDPESRARMNRAVFDTLKSGGDFPDSRAPCGAWCGRPRRTGRRTSACRTRHGSSARVIRGRSCGRS